VFRRPRFQRSNDAPPIRLTERDFLIIHNVHQHRFLRSTHICKLVGGSPPAVLRRLQLLFHHGYLDRPRAQIDYYRHGSRPMVYGLGNKGARELQQRGGHESGRLDWASKNRASTRVYLEHTLGVAEVMIAIEIACLGKTDIRFVPPEAIQRKSNRQPLQWSVNLRYKGKSERLGVIPDQVFALEFVGQPDKTLLVFLELDRATMPVSRGHLQSTSFFRKMLAYQESWQQKLHTSLFTYQRCLVLAVTTSRQRVATLIEANRSLNNGRGSGLFVFTDKDVVGRTEDLLRVKLQNGRDEAVSLGAN
jgi:hypothetical protein